MFNIKKKKKLIGIYFRNKENIIIIIYWSAEKFFGLPSC